VAVGAGNSGLISSVPSRLTRTGGVVVGYRVGGGLVGGVAGRHQLGEIDVGAEVGEYPGLCSAPGSCRSSTIRCCSTAWSCHRDPVPDQPGPERPKKNRSKR
jgi:hypothetical protein